MTVYVFAQRTFIGQHPERDNAVRQAFEQAVDAMTDKPALNPEIINLLPSDLLTPSTRAPGSFISLPVLCAAFNKSEDALICHSLLISALSASEVFHEPPFTGAAPFLMHTKTNTLVYGLTGTAA